MRDRLTICTGSHAGPNLARAVETHLLDGIAATRMAELFQALADPTRVRIVSLLAHMELCVGDLSLVLGMKQPAISYQLRTLRTLRIVRARKAGKHVFYTLADAHVYDLFHQALAHTQHD